ncbi:activating signal cointegrator 1 complex subunit 1-like [Diadema antillarum]|uniref:activating signal cointegrator 1 complex subunit 1-like n=1 Tax=Diadema antillarum TaxID=105358 RepID=UPI003A87CE2B
MDVLKPPIITIGGRCYRCNPAQVSSYAEVDEEEERYQDHDECMLDAEMDDESCDQVEIMKFGDLFKVVMEVPAAFFGFIIGRRGEMKRKIEEETQTKVDIPRGNQVERISITGKNRNGVCSAKTRIDVLVDSARKREPFTHFVSFPLNSQAVMDRFSQFKEEVLANCSHCYGIEDKIMQIPAKLHLTVTTLVLMNKREIDAAQDILDECQETIINPILKGQPLLIDVAGLEYMNDDPGRVSVLYGKVRMRDGSNKLQDIADRIRQRFLASPLSQDKFEKAGVKLHMTVMNASFRQKDLPDTRAEGRGRGRPSANVQMFDVTEILQRFRDFFFGEHCIDSVHISERGRYGDDGFYRPAGKIVLQ